MQDQTISLKRFGEDLVAIQQRVDQEKLIKYEIGALEVALSDSSSYQLAS